MKAVIQKVSKASVSVDQKTINSIGKGLLVLIGIGKGDTEKDLDYIVDKTLNMRIFENDSQKMDLSVKDVGGEILLVSQFTLYGECRKGRRPDFGEAANPRDAEHLYRLAFQKFNAGGIKTKEGQFQTFMKIDLQNDGPVTIIIDSNK